MKRVRIHSSTKGALGEDEDWWYLVHPDEGKPYIEHEWHHQNPYKLGKTDQGIKHIKIDEFLDGNFPQIAKENLRKLLDSND